MLQNELIENILAWKKRWGVIHTIELPHEPKVQTYYYRSLTPIEFRHIRELTELDSKKDWDLVTVSMGILYPTIDDIHLPGTISQLAALILDVSTPNEEQLISIVEDARKWAEKSTKEQFSINLCLGICNIFPSINLLDLLEMSTEGLIRLAALVEISTKTQIFKTNSDIKTAGLKPGVKTTLGKQVESVQAGANKLRQEIEQNRRKSEEKDNE